MLKPSFRYFIIPLGAISTLATLSAQNVAPRAERAQGTMVVREQVEVWLQPIEQRPKLGRRPAELDPGEHGNRSADPAHGLGADHLPVQVEAGR